MEYHLGGHFYKGNLHAHTTASDGQRPPQEVVGIYQQHGYDFLALTDHRLYHGDQFSDMQDFVVLPGIEVDMHFSDTREKCHHIIGLCGELDTNQRIEPKQVTCIEDSQAMLDDMTQKGLRNIYCHPNWSHTSITDFGKLDEYFAIEVYNNGCWLENGTGFAMSHWDDLLRSGKNIYGVATDDAHNDITSLGGWVCVNASKRSRAAIMGALLKGNFYASNGPVIEEIAISDGEIFVCCDKCNRVQFITQKIDSSIQHAFGQPVRQARFSIPEDARYIRVQIGGEGHQMAWSQPIFL